MLEPGLFRAFNDAFFLDAGFSLFRFLLTKETNPRGVAVKDCRSTVGLCVGCAYSTSLWRQCSV